MRSFRDVDRREGGNVSHSDELRLRCTRLRERSRDLRQRSQVWRGWLPGGAERAPSSEAGSRVAAAAANLQRLLRAESDLESAIAECRSALEDVRRELRWQDPRDPSVIH
jgi:chromosome segregation ATPase